MFTLIVSINRGIPIDRYPRRFRTQMCNSRHLGFLVFHHGDFFWGGGIFFSFSFALWKPWLRFLPDPTIMIFYLQNSFAVMLCLVTFTLCLVCVISTAIISIPFLERFSTCIARPTLAQCQCYILEQQSGNNNTNSGIFLPGGKYTWTQTHQNLPDVV